jgi:hypothetical protein
MCITGENTTRLSPSVQQLMLEALRSPRQAKVTIAPTSDGAHTEIRLDCADGTAQQWTFAVAPHAITDKDIRPVRRFLRRPAGRWSAALTTALQFVGWSVGLTGLFAASTACPCCGQVGCPLGIGTMGILSDPTRLQRASGATAVRCGRVRG